MTAHTSQADLDSPLLRRLQQIESAAQELLRQPRRLLYLIEITDECSLACPVCYTSSTSGHGRHRPLEQILALGSRVLADGGRSVQLMGGEPTEHPELPEIARGLRNLGLRPVLATNGVRLGTDPAFATELRLAGISKVNVQFDTLDAATSIAMRGQDLVALKRQAITNAIAAGLRVGLIATICARNVSETAAILRFALDFTPHLNAVTFQTMVPVGRVPAGLDPVQREDILSALLSSAAGEGISLSPEDIMPPPQYVPWRALTHPSCSSMLYLCRDADSDSLWSLGRDVDLERFYGILHAANRSGDSIVDMVLHPLAALWRCTRPGRKLATLGRMASLASGRGNRHLCIVNVDSNMHHGSLNEERLRRCPACFVTENGFQNVCGVLRSTDAGGEKAEAMP